MIVLGARVVAGPRGPLDRLGAVVVAGGLGLGGAQPGAGDLEVAHLGQRRAQDAGEAGRSAADDRAGDPPLLVGVGAQRDVQRLAGDPARRSASSPRRRTPRGATGCAGCGSTVDRAGLAESQPRRPGQRPPPAPCPARGRRGRRRSGPRRCAPPRPRRRRPPRSRGPAARAARRCPCRPWPCTPARPSRRRAGPWAAGRPGRRSPSSPRCVQHLGHLQADVAAAEHHRPPRARRRWPPGCRRRRPAGARRARRRRPAPGRRAQRPAAGGDDERVVAERLPAPVVTRARGAARSPRRGCRAGRRCPSRRTRAGSGRSAGPGPHLSPTQ